MTDMKKLYKNEHDEVLTGVIGGVGEYFSVDPTILRIAFVVLVLITGVFPGIIAYIIAYFIIPDTPHGVSTLVTPPPMKTEVANEATFRRGSGIDESEITVKKPIVTETNEIASSAIKEMPEPGPITTEESTMTVKDLMTPTKPEPIRSELEQTEKMDDSAEPKSPTAM